MSLKDFNEWYESMVSYEPETIVNRLILLEAYRNVDTPPPLKFELIKLLIEYVDYIGGGQQGGCINPPDNDITPLLLSVLRSPKPNITLKQLKLCLYLYILCKIINRKFYPTIYLLSIS